MGAVRNGDVAFKQDNQDAELVGVDVVNFLVSDSLCIFNIIFVELFAVGGLKMLLQIPMWRLLDYPQFPWENFTRKFMDDGLILFLRWHRLKDFLVKRIQKLLGAVPRINGIVAFKRLYHVPE
ncbi:hypothetical protein EEK90_03275 [Muribaculaceae bacterium Isolate-036 (Harlan)]|nr:hypothetical protein EEK90_03275 [Muribaculaceae bacterium Isolate-036 (Harlan)]